jgi:hypothetical protein
MKKTFLMLLLCGVLAASPVKFKESRYIEATGKTINLKGDIDFSKESIIVHYTHPSKRTLMVVGNMLTIENSAGEKEMVELNKNKQFEFYFFIFRAINEKNIDAFKDFFEIIKTKDGYKMNPKNDLKRSIVAITVKAEADKPKNIKIELINGDKIEIDAEN